MSRIINIFVDFITYQAISSIGGIFIPYIRSYLNTEIYFEEYGEKSFPPLVMITGLASNMLQWQPILIAELSQHFRIILMDNRGCGRSGSSRRFYTMKTYAKDIISLLEYLRIEKASFLGHSLGGSIVQRFVIIYPDKIDKVVLISPDIGSLKRKFPSFRILQMLLQGLDTDANTILKYAFCIQNNEETNKHSIRIALDCIERVFRYYPISKKDYYKQLLAVLFFSTFNQVKKIKNKTLILTGDCDKIVSPENAVRLARKLPYSTLTIMHNCGHLFLYDDLKPFLEEMYEFLGENSK